MPRRTERGAAAVEFALISGILFTVLFGILQYGLFFNDSLNVRQGVREAVRQGVVENFGPGGSGCTTGTNSAKLACYTKQQIGTSGQGSVYVKILALDASGNPVAAGGWTKGLPLVICAEVKSVGANGLLPMPNGGYVISKTQLSIEQDASKASWANYTADTLPAGLSWPSGC